MPLKYYLIVCGVMSLVAFFMFAMDKAAAADGRRRIPEITLLTVASLGGALGAMLGKTLLRHKSNAKKKLHFAVILTTALLLQAALLVVLLIAKF